MWSLCWGSDEKNRPSCWEWERSHLRGLLVSFVSQSTFKCIVRNNLVNIIEIQLAGRIKKDVVLVRHHGCVLFRSSVCHEDVDHSCWKLFVRSDYTDQVCDSQNDPKSSWAWKSSPLLSINTYRRDFVNTIVMLCVRAYFWEICYKYNRRRFPALHYLIPTLGEVRELSQIMQTSNCVWLSLIDLLGEAL